MVEAVVWIFLLSERKPAMREECRRCIRLRIPTFSFFSKILQQDACSVCGEERLVPDVEWLTATNSSDLRMSWEGWGWGGGCRAESIWFVRTNSPSQIPDFLSFASRGHVLSDLER